MSKATNDRLLISRDENMAKCLTSPLNESASVNVSQNIIFKWPERDRVPQPSDVYTFTYLPNPIIEDIYPNTTILRYDSHDTD